MNYYCGIDLHSNNNFIVIIDESGKEIFQKRLPNDLNTIVLVLDKWKTQLHDIVVESTYNWYWLVDGLMDNNYKVHLANPAAIKQYDGIKHTNDQTDANWLAQLVRLGILKEGYIYPKEQRPLRDLLRKRGILVKQRTANILSGKNLILHNTGIHIKKDEMNKFNSKDVCNLLPEENLALAVNSTIAITQFLEQQISKLEKVILKEVKLKPEFELLLTVSGIGKILAMTIMLETGDINRFPKVGNYSSYCRCVDSKKTTNGKKKGTGNTKSGNKYLSWAYVEAANYAVRFNPQIKRFHQKKASKTMRVVATKAVAHKLSRACYHIIKEQKAFDVGRAFA